VGFFVNKLRLIKQAVSLDGPKYMYIHRFGKHQLNAGSLAIDGRW